MHWMNGHYWGMHFWWWVFWVVLLLIITYRLIRDSDEKKAPGDPLEILKRRYARGEISKEEYEKMKKDPE